MNQYETKNYPFEISIDSKKFNGELQIETPWIDEGKFWDEVESEVLVDRNDPFLRIVKSDYKNGFKLILIEYSSKTIIKTNWALDEMEEGIFLPRIEQLRNG